MSLEEFYNIIGGNADMILNRFNDEMFIKKFIVMFLDDPTFKQLNEDIKNNNKEKANFDAHTLKGVCAILDFIKLKEAVEQFTLCLKQGNNFDEIWQTVVKEYNLIIETINKFKWKDLQFNNKTLI